MLKKIDISANGFNISLCCYVTASFEVFIWVSPNCHSCVYCVYVYVCHHHMCMKPRNERCTSNFKCDLNFLVGLLFWAQFANALEPHTLGHCMQRRGYYLCVLRTYCVYIFQYRCVRFYFVLNTVRFVLISIHLIQFISLVLAASSDWTCNFTFYIDYLFYLKWSTMNGKQQYALYV